MPGSLSDFKEPKQQLLSEQEGWRAASTHTSMHAAPVPGKQGYSCSVVTRRSPSRSRLTLYVVLFQVYPLQHRDEIGSTLACSILCTSQNVSSRQGDRNALLLQEHRTHWSQRVDASPPLFTQRSSSSVAAWPTLFNWAFRL